MKSLVQQIQEASVAYYVNSNSHISDDQFDSLVEQLRLIDPNHPVLTTTGWGAKSSDWEVAHWSPMTGIDQLKYDNEFGADHDFDNTWRSRVKSLTAKLDGISGTARYFNGQLVDVLTRGDGEHGKDITKVALLTGKIPTKLPEHYQQFGRVEVRGEFVLSYEAHLELVRRELARLDTNLRNVTSGIMNSDDGVGAELVSFVAFSLLVEGLPNSVAAIESAGLEVVDHFTNVYSFEGCWDLVSPYRIGDKYKYPTDGLVMITESGDKYKIKFSKLPTVVVPNIKVNLHTTRTGRVIPHATFDPVYLDGSWISACTLNNLSWIRTQFSEPAEIELVQFGIRTKLQVPAGQDYLSIMNPKWHDSLFAIMQNGRTLEATIYTTPNQVEVVVRGIEPKYKPIWNGSTVVIQKANQIIPQVINVITPVEVPTNDKIAEQLNLANWSDTGADLIDLDARDDEVHVMSNLIYDCMPKGAGEFIFECVTSQLRYPEYTLSVLRAAVDYPHYDLELDGVGDSKKYLINDTLHNLRNKEWDYVDLILMLSIAGVGASRAEAIVTNCENSLVDIISEVRLISLPKGELMEVLANYLGPRLKPFKPAEEVKVDETGKLRFSMTGKLNGYSKAQFAELVEAVWDDSDYQILVTDSDRISSKMQRAIDDGKTCLSSSDFLSQYKKVDLV